MAQTIHRSKANAIPVTSPRMNLWSFDGVPVQLNVDLASTAPDYRPKLRERLRQHVLTHSISTPPDEVQFRKYDCLLDLATPPRLAGWAISVSHCPLLGGFIAVPSEYSIGIDFELSQRVTRQTANRIAIFPKEPRIVEQLENAEDFYAFFWSVKEAAIKACGNAFPQERPHFGEVEVLKMSLEENTFEARRGEANILGRLLKPIVISNERVVGAVARIIS